MIKTKANIVSTISQVPKSGVIKKQRLKEPTVWMIGAQMKLDMAKDYDVVNIYNGRVQVEKWAWVQGGKFIFTA